MHDLFVTKRFVILRATSLALLVVAAFPNLFAIMPMGADRMPHFAWEQISMEHQLPSPPIAIGAATDLGDFIAVIKNKKNSASDIYFFDHTNIHLGWQKRSPLSSVIVSSIQYGLGKFFIFGIDSNNLSSLVFSSNNGGASWNRQEIPSSTSHYDVAAFSGTQGVATGREGAVIKTSDGNTWAQVIAPSSVEKKVFAIHENSSTPSGFVVIEATRQKCDGFFFIDDFSQLEPLFSTDTINWKRTNASANGFAAGVGELLIYQGKGFAYRYAGVETGADYSQTPARNTTPHFQATKASLVPQIKILDAIVAPIGQRTGWIYLGQDLKTKQSLLIYSGNRSFFVADASPTTLNNPIVAISTTTSTGSEKEPSSGNTLLAVAHDGSVFAASTAL